MEGYLELLYAGYLNQIHPMYTTYGETVATIFAYISLLITLVGIPMLYLRIFTLSINQINHPKFK